MDKLRELLSGKKTYITGAIIFILGGLKAIGVDVPEDMIVALLGIMGITLRQGIKKAEK